MIDPDYNALVTDHFERPRNVGNFDQAADVIAGASGNREQGARFTISARIVNEAIAAARFEAYGCPHCVAAGSWLTERLVGTDRDTLARWSWRDTADALGVPTEKRGRLLILEDAVRAMAQDWAKRF